MDRGFGLQNLGRGLEQPPLVRRVTKNSLVRRGLSQKEHLKILLNVPLKLILFEVDVGLHTTIMFCECKVDAKSIIVEYNTIGS